MAVFAAGKDAFFPPGRSESTMGALFVSGEAKAIKRHRNPLGFFSRAFICPLIGFGAWHLRLEADPIRRPPGGVSCQLRRHGVLRSARILN